MEFEGPNFVATGGSGGAGAGGDVDTKPSGSDENEIGLQERSDSMSSRDFSNPMYEAAIQQKHQSEGGAGGLSQASSKSGTGSSMSFTMEPPSAVIAPSKVTHTGPPSPPSSGGGGGGAVKHKELSPSGVDTGKDTQCLVEEDDSEC